MKHPFLKEPGRESRTQIHREASHALLAGYESAEEARLRAPSPNVQSLDGEWDFALYESLEDVPEELPLQRCDIRWSKIRVPGNWELQGHKAPVYTNKIYPFDREGDIGNREGYLLNARRDGTREDIRFFEQFNPPAVPKKNAVGVYRRSFVLTQDPAHKSIYLHFDGVEAAYYLYVNGHPIGYSEDSKLPSEFDVTHAARKGENTVTVLVLRFCAGTWLEGQDYFHLSGIYRSVRLLAKPRRAIRDIMIDAVPDISLASGVVTARCFVRRVEHYADCRVRLELFSADGERVAECEKPIDTLAPISGLGTALNEKYMRPLPESAKFKLSVAGITPWSCDKPVLYTAVFTLLDENGAGIDFESCRAGFRRIAIDDQVITLNYKRFVFRGMNRHDHDYRTGRALTGEHMTREILLMKSLNVNAVRSSHYPNDPVFYDLCDEYGLCVVCEANVESHAIYGMLSNHPEWSEAMLERARRTVMTHRNHPSIVSWSLGNESGYGPAHAAMANWIRAYDPTRLVQYENNDPGAIASDIRCTMYPTLSRILMMLADPKDRRPLVPIEYAYQISNSGGGLSKFNEMTETYALFQGAFFWDFQDKCILAKDEGGREFLGYSGDFGEDYVEWNSPPFMCANGMVFSDLSPKPVAEELKIAQAPVSFAMSADRSGWFLLQNRFHAIATHELEIRYEIAAGGQSAESGTVEFARVDRTDYAGIAEKFKMPGIKEVIDFGPEDYLFHIDLSAFAQHEGEVFVTLRASLKNDLVWAGKGFEITAAQFEVKGYAGSLPGGVPPKGLLRTQAQGRGLTVSGDGFAVMFDLEKNLITRYEKDGTEFLLPSGHEVFRRARSGLHLGERWWGRCESDWNALPDTEKLPLFANYLVAADGSSVQVNFQNKYEGTAGDVLTEQKITVLADGSLRMDVAFDIAGSLGTVPRLGVEWVLPEGFEKVRWHGRGPGENYSDRRLSAPVGQYQAAVEEMHLPFVPPSHCGTRTDTREVAFENEGGHKIIFSGAPFCFTAHHNTISDYRNAMHDHELIRRPEVYVQIDGFHSGIGGNMAWSTEVDDRDLIRAGRHSFGFSVRVE